jgi:hypothetical protein
MKYTDEKLKELKEAREVVVKDKGYELLDNILKEYVAGAKVAAYRLSETEVNILTIAIEREQAISNLFDYTVIKGTDSDIYLVRILFKD